MENASVRCKEVLKRISGETLQINNVTESFQKQYSSHICKSEGSSNRKCDNPSVELCRSL